MLLMGKYDLQQIISTKPEEAEHKTQIDRHYLFKERISRGTETAN
jgi:hypothetical protein